MPTDEWKNSGVRVIPGDQLDGNTAQTPGMDRKAAINYARVGAQKLWAGKYNSAALLPPRSLLRPLLITTRNRDDSCQC